MDDGSAEDVRWPLGDHQQTVRDIVAYDEVQQGWSVANHVTYDAFGKVTAETNAAVDHLFGYTGRPFDEATGLQNNLNRWYDPAIGRWLSEDPISFEGGDASLYRYAGNSPANHVDPTGLFLKELGDFLNPLSGFNDTMKRRTAERDRLSAIIARGDFDSAFAMRKAQVNALGGATEGLLDVSILQVESAMAAPGLADAAIGIFSRMAGGAGRAAARVGSRGAVTMGEGSPVWAGRLVRQYASKVRGVRGFTDVFLHGMVDGTAFSVIHNGKKVILNHRQIAAWLRSRGVKGNIRLISCYSGSRPTGGVAQNLANKLGVTVRAPTNAITIHPNGMLTAPVGTVWRDFFPGI